MNRISSRTLAVIALPLVIAGGLFALHRGSIEPFSRPIAAQVSPVADTAPEARLQTPRFAETVADFYGAYVYADGQAFQVEELVWGIQHNGDIGFAVLVAQAADGKRIDYRHPERYSHIALTPEELVGAYMVDGNTQRRFKLAAVRYGVFSDGSMGVVSWSGWDDTGAATGFGDPLNLAAAPPCCGLRSTATCTAAGCTGVCPGPTNCACSNGTGGCTLGTEYVCGGVCKAGDPCWTFDGVCNGSVEDCKCIAPPPPPPPAGGDDGDGDGDGG